MSGKKPAKISGEVTNPDDWRPGLSFGLKALNVKNVGRAQTHAGVVDVVMRHNTRIGNEDHRHRSPIDKERTHLNQVLRGPGDPHEAAECAANMLTELGIEVRRHDNTMEIELVFQPPDGCDTPAFYEASLKWTNARYQARFVLSAIVHRDQKRPHMHVVVLPIVESDGEYRLCGAELSSGPNRLEAQRSSFMAFIRHELGIRPDRKPRSTTATFTSPGKGPKTHAAAAKSDAALMARAAARADKATEARAQVQAQAKPEVANLIAHQPHSPPGGPTDLIAQTSYCARISALNRLFDEGISAGHFPRTSAIPTLPAPRPLPPLQEAPTRAALRSWVLPAGMAITPADAHGPARLPMRLASPVPADAPGLAYTCRPFRVPPGVAGITPKGGAP